MSFTPYRPDKVTLSRLSKISSFITIQAPIGAGKSRLLSSLAKVIDEKGVSTQNTQNEESVIFSWIMVILSFLGILTLFSWIQTIFLWITSSHRRHVFIIIEEPVKGWTGKSYSVTYKDGSFEKIDATNFPSINEKGEANILQLFGDNMKMMALAFQICAFTSRIQLIAEELGKIDQSILNNPFVKIHIISERSVTTDRLFFENLYDSNMVRGYEWDIYNAFYNMFCEELLEKENIMIYLNTSVNTCQKRIKSRGRVEEKNLPRDYLESLDIAHKELIEKTRRNPKRKVFTVDFEEEFRTDIEVDAVSDHLLTDIITHINTITT